MSGRGSSSHSKQRRRLSSESSGDNIKWQSVDEEMLRSLHGRQVDYSKGNSRVAILSETYYSFMWWMSFQVLTTHIAHPSILFPSLPSIVPFLVACLSLLLPCVLYMISYVQQALLYPIMLCIVRLTSVLLIIYHVFTGTHTRLVVLLVGGIATVLSLMANWYNMSIIDRYRKAHCHIFGLVLMIVAKIWSKSSNLMLLHETLFSTPGIILGVSIIFVLYLNDTRTPPLNELFIKKSPRNYHLNEIGNELWVCLGVGFGCQLFITQLLFTDADIMKGLLGIPINTFVLSLHVFALCVGLSCGLNNNHFVLATVQWLIIGIVPFIFLCIDMFPWLYFMGGLLLSVHIGGFWFLLSPKLSQPLSLLVGLSIYIVLVKLGSYNLYRWSLSTLLLLPAIIYQWKCFQIWVDHALRYKRIKKPSTPRRVSKRKRSYVLIVGRLVRRLSTLSEFEEEDETEKDDSDNDKEKLRELVLNESKTMKEFDEERLPQVLLWALIVTMIGSAFGIFQFRPTNVQIGPVFNVSVLSMRNGYDDNGYYNHWKMMNVINESNSDIVCLYDVSREFINGIASVESIGGQLGMIPYYSSQRHPQIAVLTRYRVLRFNHSTWREVTLNVSSTLIPSIMVVCQNSRSSVQQLLQKNNLQSIVISKDPFDSSQHHEVTTPTNCSDYHVSITSKFIKKSSSRCSVVEGLTKILTVTIGTR